MLARKDLRLWQAAVHCDLAMETLIVGVENRNENGI
jgi:hypothetical protein